MILDASRRAAVMLNMQKGLGLCVVMLACRAYIIISNAPQTEAFNQDEDRGCVAR